MTVKCHSVNATVTYYHTIMKVLSHYHKEVIVIELLHEVLAVFEPICRRICVLKAFRSVLLNIFINGCVHNENYRERWRIHSGNVTQCKQSLP